MIRVVIVDDSSLSRMILKKILEADGDIEVVGEAVNGFEAVPKIQEHKPDLVTMDIDMPGPNGLETIQRVMHSCPVPILVVTGERLGPESDIGFRAIQLGALDFMAKPSIGDTPSMTRLRRQVRALAGVPVFLHNDDRDEQASSRVPSLPEAPPFSLVAIASGTGGPKAVATILQALPDNFGAPVVIVQQMPEKFGPAFAKYLQGLTPLRITMVEPLPRDCLPGDVLMSGSDDAHVYFPRRGVVVGMHAEPYAMHRPSATVMMRSIAETYGAEAVGIILSGTGDDGLEGLAAMRAAGALTLAESPSSAAIAELPAAALKSGAASRGLPAQMIANCLISAMTAMSRKTTAPPSSAALLEYSQNDDVGR
ncbi:MAG: chemotaxis protein CheB [Labilithrix sp.]|nr:chemotaxis protein CheB [Labilithrix sp.]MBX3223876.1 chemotaxis protein CheB [Labilithrix sp.]